MGGGSTPAAHGSPHRNAHLAYRPVDDAFRAREAIADIVERVEADFGLGALEPLVQLIDSVNQLESVQTTHTAAFHRAETDPNLLTSLIVMPKTEPGKYAWWNESEVANSAVAFVKNLEQKFVDPPRGLSVFIGGIEVLMDPAGAKIPGCGLEFQIEGSGKTSKGALEVWQWGALALKRYVLSFDSGAAIRTEPHE